MVIAKIESKFHIFRSAGIIGAFTLLSRLVGFYRDHLFAARFGAGDILDSYYVAFRIPDLVFNLLILGTLSAAFIPVFAEYFVKDEEEANKVANTILNLSFIFISILCLIMYFFVPQITHLIAPGFEGQKLNDTIMVTKIFLLSPVIFTVSNVFSSILNARKKFFLVSLAPIIYNFGIIFGALFLYPRFGLRGLAYGVILGALGHLIIQVWGSFTIGFKYQPLLNWNHPAVRKFIRLFLPRIIGVDSSQISLLVASIIGSTLATGSIAIFNFANNLQAVAIGMFGIAFAIAAFPSLSEDYARGDESSFNSMLARTMVHVLYFVIPVSVLIFILRNEIVDIVLRAGQFSADAAHNTALTLGIFAVSIFAQSLSPLFSRSFYARGNTWTPVLTGLFTLTLNGILAYELSPHYGIAGLGIAFSVSNIINAFMLYTLLHRRLKNFDSGYVHGSIFKILSSSIVMAVVTFLVLIVVNHFDTGSFIFTAVRLLLAGFVGVGVYIGFTYTLKMNESRIALDLVKKRIFR
jgi:putative peptidoglycan lipid II flippase